MNNPTFFIRDVQGYIDFFPVVQALREGKIIFKPGEPPDVPADLQAKFQSVAYAFPMLQKIRAKLTTSPLEISYWSATSYKLGSQAIKFSVVPHAIGENFNPENAAEKSNYLREAMTKHLASKDACFDFKIQLQTDAVKMPVEDPTVEWDEQESPYVKAATPRDLTSIFVHLGTTHERDRVADAICCKLYSQRSRTFFNSCPHSNVTLPS